MAYFMTHNMAHNMAHGVRQFNHRAVAAVMAFVCCLFAWADDVRTVNGEFTYYGNGDQSRNECMRLALESARNDAIAKTFGTRVTQTATSSVTIDKGLESSYENFLSQTEVSGLWIADVGEPTYDVTIDDKGNFVVTCKVKGKAKGIDNKSVDFEAVVLKNNTKGQQTESRFNANDHLYVSLKAPSDGYVAIYLVDDRQNVYTLFPYMGENATAVKIKRDKKYVFFDTDSEQPNGTDVDEIYMMTDRQVERNDLYVIYSPNEFNKAKDEDMGPLAPRQLALKDFNKWLINVRHNDPYMSVKRFAVEINGEAQY